MVIAIGLLLLVLIPGIGARVGGARSWINLGPLSFQPTDFAKVAVIIYLSSWFMNREKKRFVPFISLMGFLIMLIMLQPDMGTATIILAISLVMYFLAGSQLLFFFAMIPALIAGFGVLAIVAPYRVARITAFLHPTADPLGVGYHINQIFISLHNGGIMGRGFGASKQKYLYLPEAHTDSIFAIIGEEFGFIGASLLIFLLFVFVYRMYQITYTTTDRFGRFLGGGNCEQVCSY
jgi:cell division protein FtsW